MGGRLTSPGPTYNVIYLRVRRWLQEGDGWAKCLDKKTPQAEDKCLGQNKPPPSPTHTYTHTQRQTRL